MGGSGGSGASGIRRERPYRQHAKSAQQETGMSSAPAWWTIRRAHSNKPATYTCPFCRRRLTAMSEHVLIAPEGDMSRRRHAHTNCAMAARRAGRLPTRDEAFPRGPGPLARLLRRLRR
jgi:hypothetical protein